MPSCLSGVLIKWLVSENEAQTVSVSFGKEGNTTASQLQSLHESLSPIILGVFIIYDVSFIGTWTVHN